MAKPRYELWGEMVREVGVLLLVFGPLDFLENTQEADFTWMSDSG